jgi:hypothetical protein
MAGDQARMRPVVVVDDYLDQIDAQREQIFSDLATLTMGELWRRPARHQWSIGETLDHTRVLNRSLRRLIERMWPLLRIIASRSRRHGYRIVVENPYERTDFPSWAGFLWKPRYHPMRPVSRGELQSMLHAEHRALRNFYEGKPEELLGRARLYDPLIGRLNMIQILMLARHHDEHHFELARRIRARLHSL